VRCGWQFGHGVRDEAEVHWRAQVGWPVRPDELRRSTRLVERHAALLPLHAVPGDEHHRHRVQHLVADHHALECRRQCVDPAHLVGELRHFLGQALALAFAQGAGEIDDGVAIDRGTEFCQRLQQLACQRARAGAELPDLARAGGGECLRDLAGQRAAEQRREFRRGDEVTAGRGQGAELPVAAAVVAQARLVERQRHEALEADPAAAAADLVGDEGGQRVAGYTGERGGGGVHRPIVER
jgi:hypothetical protein